MPFSFRDLSLSDNSEGAHPRPPQQRLNILEATKLSKLPSLPKRENIQPAAQTVKPIMCRTCRKSLKNDLDFLQNVGVCRECLKFYSEIDAALNQAAEMKSLTNIRQRFLSKLEAK